MQFVYAYWHGGAQSDELRWSMRSVTANFQGSSSLLVVGDPPDWYTGAKIFRKQVKPQPRQGYRDVLNKIHTACVSDKVDDTFVWMMDDIYFVKSVTVEILSRHYRGGTLPATYKDHSHGWPGLKADTFRVIKDEKLPLVDYCTHLPHVLEKEKWLYIWDKYGLSDRVLQWELLYGAEFFREHCPVRIIRTRVRKNGASFDNVGIIGNNSNRGWSNRLRFELMNMFPDPTTDEVPDSMLAPNLVEAVKQVIGTKTSKYLDLQLLLANPVAELDKFADCYDPYVPKSDYLSALSLVQECLCG